MKRKIKQISLKYLFYVIEEDEHFVFTKFLNDLLKYRTEKVTGTNRSNDTAWMLSSHSNKQLIVVALDELIENYDKLLDNFTTTSFKSTSDEDLFIDKIIALYIRNSITDLRTTKNDAQLAAKDRTISPVALITTLNEMSEEA